MPARSISCEARRAASARSACVAPRSWERAISAFSLRIMSVHVSITGHCDQEDEEGGEDYQKHHSVDGTPFLFRVKRSVCRGCDRRRPGRWPHRPSRRRSGTSSYRPDADSPYPGSKRCMAIGTPRPHHRHSIQQACPHGCSVHTYGCHHRRMTTLLGPLVVGVSHVVLNMHRATREQAPLRQGHCVPDRWCWRSVSCHE